MKKQYGLLGQKLGHSFSPLIHSCLGEYNYALYEVAAGELKEFMMARCFEGINVTIPYKQAVIPFCASLSPEARLAGSVNTIIKDKEGLLHGYNTDFYGFRVLLKEGGIDPQGKKALVLGDGGAARTVRAVLRELGAGEIVTISRHGANHYGNIARHYDAQVIVNTTPLGMYPNNESSPLSLRGFTRLLGVADLIYNPLRTKLLLEAKRLGIPCVNGLTMLVAQAELASRLFLCQPACLETLANVLNIVRKKTQNIVLIGMPGCGKSIVGQQLAQTLGQPFADIDSLIEKAVGKTIPLIFAEDGEEAFRRLETHVLGEQAKKTGIVIATGGGVITRPENLELLQQNSIIIYLKRKLSELVTEGRPLSKKEGIQRLAKNRLPLYEAWSDYTISVEADIMRTITKIREAIV